MIDTTKNYQTKDGKRVVNLQYTPKNNCGHLVTYPIKGSIVTREKPRKYQYHIWPIDGISDVVWGKRSNLNLVENPKP